ncbi:MAG TPA: hypothetical protein VF743_01370 [Acidimicrobiales bacterium]
MADPPQVMQRALLPDARGAGRFLRVSWHPSTEQFVVSMWEGESCVSAVRLVADAATELVQLLSQGLADVTLGRTGPDAAPA